jgi:nucleotide-binding universal stress UspA family protein
MFQRILLAWDGSQVSLSAFDAAIDVARRYEAELVAVSIAYSPAHAETAADRDETADAAHRYLTQT